MTNLEYGKIISKNLKRIAYDNQKSQADIARDLGLKQATVSSWMNGTRIPRMSKIDLLCHYFNCKRVDIMEEHVASEPLMTAEEKAMLRLYRELNSIGKEKVMEYITDLSENQKYTKDTSSQKEKAI